MISKKELLKEMNISYGQLYRWKREGLIPDEWFNKQAVATGQETYFKRNLIIPRIQKIIELKDHYQIEELKAFFTPHIKGRIYEIRELVVIDEIDPIILKMYAHERKQLNLFDVIIIFIFSTNTNYLDYHNYRDYDFSKIDNLNATFYIVEIENRYLFMIGEALVLDPQIKIIKAIKFEEIIKKIALSI